MRRRDKREAEHLLTSLTRYEAKYGTVPGIRLDAHRTAFLEQVIESGRRSRYVTYVVGAELSQDRMDPSSELFDPVKAAVLQQRIGSVDEAFWMVFLYAHFGKHRRGGWRYAGEVYARLGTGPRWDWESVRGDVVGFRNWLEEHADAIRANGVGGFGNHRKYESLGGWSEAGTGSVVASYVDWVGSSGSHLSRFDKAMREARGQPQEAFDNLFRSMNQVHRFGRTARFDYLAMVKKLGLAPISPGRAYLDGATGPLKGARLLFGTPIGPSSLPAALEMRLATLEMYLRVGFSDLEDALCNWQKSPAVFKPFRG